MKRSKLGEWLWRDMKVSVCLPDQKDIVWRKNAGPKRGWTADQLSEMMEKVADSVEQRYPTIEFRLVELAPNDFKFIYHGRKKTMNENLNACPEVARSVSIATELCAKQGHKLSVYQNGMTNTPNGPQMNTINFCSNCGLSLAEVRGEIDARINTAIAQGIQERLAALAASAKPAGASAGPFAVPTVSSAKPEEQGEVNGPTV